MRVFYLESWLLIALIGVVLVSCFEEDIIQTCAFSPDGRHIAYLSSHSGLQVYDIGSKRHIELEKQKIKGTRIDWAPDSSKIVFCSCREGSWNVYEITLDKTITPLTSGPFKAYDPVYSADGQQVFYCSYRNGDCDVWSVNVKSKEQDVVVDGRGDQIRPLPSPNGAYLAYTSYEFGTPELMVYNVKTGAKTRITHDPEGRIVDEYDVSWTTDSKLIYCRKLTGQWHVFTSDAVTGATTSLAQSDYTISSPVLSDDCETLFFIAGKNMYRKRLRPFAIPSRTSFNRFSLSQLARSRALNDQRLAFVADDEFLVLTNPSLKAFTVLATSQEQQLRLVAAYEAHGKIRKADDLFQSLLEDVLTADDNESRVYLTRAYADFLCRHGKPKRALAILKTLEAEEGEDIDHSELYEQIAGVYLFGLEDYEQAQGYYEMQYLSLDKKKREKSAPLIILSTKGAHSQNMRRHYVKAVRHLMGKEYKSSFREFRKALKAFPGNYALHDEYLRALTEDFFPPLSVKYSTSPLLVPELYPDVIEMLEFFVSTVPNSPHLEKAQEMLGLLYYESGDWEKYRSLAFSILETLDGSLQFSRIDLSEETEYNFVLLRDKKVRTKILEKLKTDRDKARIYINAARGMLYNGESDDARTQIENAYVLLGRYPSEDTEENAAGLLVTLKLTEGYLEELSGARERASLAYLEAAHLIEHFELDMHEDRFAALEQAVIITHPSSIESGTLQRLAQLRMSIAYETLKEDRNEARIKRALDEVVLIARTTSSKLLESVAFRYAGRCYTILNRPHLAHLSFHRALAAAEVPEVQLRILFALARFYETEEEYYAANCYYGRALSLVDASERKYLYSKISHNYEQIMDYERAGAFTAMSK